MIPNRWALVEEAGAFETLSGPVLVMGARTNADYASLGQIQAVTRQAGIYNALERRGHNVSTEPQGPFQTALVHIEKSKPATLAALWRALNHTDPGGCLMVDGQKTEGIESILKLVRGVLPVDHILSKGHGKIFCVTRPETLPDAVAAWAPVPQEVATGYVTQPGVFSADGPDPGTELLIALVPQLKGRVADLGSGWGYLGGEVLKEHAGIDTLDFIEADRLAHDLAQSNVTDPRARFHWADVRDFAPEAPFDVLLSNPPFHDGQATDPGLGQAFIAAAARMAKPSGQFFMVANRHLPYEAALKESFSTGQMLAEMNGYKLYQAAKPRKPGRGRL